MGFMKDTPLHKVFVMEAISKYANDVIEHKDEFIEAMHNHIVSGEAWVRIAEEWNMKDS